MTQLGLGLTELGWAWVVFHGAMAIASANAGKIPPTTYHWAFVILPILLAIAYIGMGMTQTLIGLSFVIVIYALRGLNIPLVLHFLNENIPSQLRATLISINSFAFRLFFLCFAPIVGLVSRLTSFHHSLFFTGIILGVIALYAFCRLFNNRKPPLKEERELENIQPNNSI